MRGIRVLKRNKDVISTWYHSYHLYEYTIQLIKNGIYTWIRRIYIPHQSWRTLYSNLRSQGSYPIVSFIEISNNYRTIRIKQEIFLANDYYFFFQSKPFFFFADCIFPLVLPNQNEWFIDENNFFSTLAKWRKKICDRYSRSAILQSHRILHCIVGILHDSSRLAHPDRNRSQNIVIRNPIFDHHYNVIILNICTRASREYCYISCSRLTRSSNTTNEPHNNFIKDSYL